MPKGYFLLLICCSLLHDHGVGGRQTQNEELITDETSAIAWLEDFNEIAMVVYFEGTLANWNFYTNLTDENQQAVVSVSAH